MVENILNYGGEGIERVKERISRLSKEWDVDRAAELNTAILGLTGTALSYFMNKGWMGLTIGVSLLMLQHALQGKGPLAFILRKFGMRTKAEIDAEKFALKAVAGEFGEPVSAYQAAQGIH